MVSSLIVDTESLRNQVIFKMHKQLIDQNPAQDWWKELYGWAYK